MWFRYKKYIYIKKYASFIEIVEFVASYTVAIEQWFTAATTKAWSEKGNGNNAINTINLVMFKTSLSCSLTGYCTGSHQAPAVLCSLLHFLCKQATSIIYFKSIFLFLFFSCLFIKLVFQQCFFFPQKYKSWKIPPICAWCQRFPRAHILHPHLLLNVFHAMFRQNLRLSQVYI